MQRRREPALVRVAEGVCPGGHAREVRGAIVLQEVLEVGLRIRMHEVGRDECDGFVAQAAPGLHAGQPGEGQGCRKAAELHD